VTTPDRPLYPGQPIIEAAEALAAARTRYSEAFTAARFRLGDKATDKQAEAIAIAQTKDEVTVLTTKLKVAEMEYYQ
jgi:hypothetical protein